MPESPTASQSNATADALYIFVAVPASPNGAGRTLRTRAGWENRFFAAGYRKHPSIQAFLPYESLEDDGDPIRLVLEQIPAQARACYPLETLGPERDLHMDMLRETGRRSDAHIARYALAAAGMQPGAVVLDAACGLGYGSAILQAGGAARVIGVDNSPSAIDYATANYGSHRSGMVFHLGDAANLAFLEKESIDEFVSFETLEHLPDPAAFLVEARRVVRPGGRIILSVPNDWTDQTGTDPSPHHLHVYTWPTLRQQVSEHFRIERAWAQIAGGGMKLTDSARSLREIPVAETQSCDAEWWILAATKDSTCTA